MKVKVSERALVARIRRALAKEELGLKACRENSRWHGDFGHWYTVDINRNTVEATHVDLEWLGKELGVLAGHEELAYD